MKMKKQGFTLVEVITVITIIGVLLLIAVPSVSKIVAKSKADTFERQVELLLEAGQNYFLPKLATGEMDIAIQSSSVITLGELIEGGYIPKVKDPDTKEDCNETTSLVTIVRSGERKYDYYADLVCTTFSFDGNTLFDEYTYRRKITIDHTKIEARLRNFPVTVILSGATTESIFTELGADKYKMAVVLEDGVSEIYAEIEHWDYTEDEAVLHISGPNFYLDPDEDTIIYLYYDKLAEDNTTYIGDFGSETAEKVWDDNFVAVYHMGLSGTSLLNSADGINNGTNVGTTDGTTGYVGTARVFDGAANHIDLGSITSDNPLMMANSNVTISTYFQPNFSGDEYQRIVDKSNAGTLLNGYGMYLYTPSGEIVTRVNGNSHIVSSTTINASKNYVVGIISSEGYKLFINRSLDVGATVTYPGGIPLLPPDVITNMKIGTLNSSTGKEYSGSMDEVRISNVARSTEWLHAEYDSITNQLLSVGVEEITD